MPDVKTIGRGYRNAAPVLAKNETRASSVSSQGKVATLKSRDVLSERFYSFETLHYQYDRHDGSPSNVIARDMLITGDSAILLPYDPKLDAVVLIEQVRPAALARGSALAWHLEPIAGYIGEGEVPIETAVREADEEAGLSITDVFEIPSSYQSPGCLSQKMYSFIGKCDLSNFQTGTYGLIEEDEDTRTIMVSRKDALAMIKSGEIDITLLQMIVLALNVFNEEICAKFA